MKIVLDCFGGDNAPDATIDGAFLALEKEKDLTLVLVGDEGKIRGLVGKKEDAGKYMSRTEILHAPEVIGNDESPTSAIRQKKDSSIVKGLELLSSDEGAGGFVSAGSTGAVLTGAFMKVGRIKGISRPALAPVLPTVNDGSVILVDCGANVDCKPLHLAHFALMGAAYASAIGTKNPKVALLNNGAEPGKGSELTKEAFEVLSKMDLNFVGNLEGRYLLSGQADVMVSDGFNGNIALKSSEGVALTMFELIMKGIKEGGLRAKIGALLLKPALKGIKKKMDYNENGGACFLGVKKVVIKSHGSSKASSICAAILQASELARAKLPERIEEELKNMPDFGTVTE